MQLKQINSKVETKRARKKRIVKRKPKTDRHAILWTLYCPHGSITLPTAYIYLQVLKRGSRKVRGG